MLYRPSLMIRSAAAMTRPSWSEKLFFEDASIDSSFSSQSSSSEKVAPPNFSTAILSTSAMKASACSAGIATPAWTSQSSESSYMSIMMNCLLSLE